MYKIMYSFIPLIAFSTFINGFILNYSKSTEL